MSASLGVAQTSCNQVECADGTIERDGKCVAASDNFDPTMCGPFTELQGDKCVPTFPPTVCEDGSTLPEVDPETGVTTCKGTGPAPGCGGSLACPAGTSATKLTICGQIYDFKDNSKFAAAGAEGMRCDPAAPATSGPCALQILAFDADKFARTPTTAPPLSVGDVYIDDCGRYRLTDIETSGTSPYIGLGFDDAGMTLGPNGVTVTVGVATAKPPARYLKDFEAWIVNQTTIGAWQTSGGPPLSGGIYAPVFRQHRKGFGDQYANQSGVSFTRMGNPDTTNDYYFPTADTGRNMIDTAASATGANGTVLVTAATIDESLAYSGTGGLGAGCRWEPHAGASLPGIVFIQVFRKIDAVVGGPCND
ncbi:MAG: hypothetical protein HOV81_31425 [Kofleriaceae bacterium]|nr:hypothetical protein [Kofleriaceae bacterium]